jgi:Ca2+-binding EF-hand superfamily protein
MQQQPPPARWSRPSTLLGLLWVCGLAAGRVPPAAAQSTLELQSYQQRLEQLFQRLDRNNDQRLQRPEVEGVPYLERHFERLDQGQRGYLTPEDLGQSANPGRRERARRWFSRADRNGDGLIERAEASDFPWLLKRFDKTDQNGDGALSREELRQNRWRRSQP